MVPRISLADRSRRFARMTSVGGEGRGGGRGTIPLVNYFQLNFVVPR